MPDKKNAGEIHRWMEYMSDSLPEKMPENTPHRVPENMLKRMPEIYTCIFMYIIYIYIYR